MYYSEILLFMNEKHPKRKRAENGSMLQKNKWEKQSWVTVLQAQGKKGYIQLIIEKAVSSQSWNKHNAMHHTKSRYCFVQQK